MTKKKKSQQAQKTQQEKVLTPEGVAKIEELPTEPTSTPEQPIVPEKLTLEVLYNELQVLGAKVDEHEEIIFLLEKELLRMRKSPMSSNGVQIKDKLTGKVYPSKNNVYQSLLKSGELKNLVDKGIFGSNPEKNNFGCYVLFRQFPDRFEVIRDVQKATD